MRLIDQKYSIRKYLYEKYGFRVYITTNWQAMNVERPFFYIQNILFRTRRMGPNTARSIGTWGLRYFPKLGQFESTEEDGLEITSEIERELTDKKYIKGYLQKYPCPKPLARAVNETPTNPLPSDLYIKIVGKIVHNNRDTQYSDCSKPEVKVKVESNQSVRVQLPFSSQVAELFNRFEIYASENNIDYYKQGETIIPNGIRCPVNFTIEDYLTAEKFAINEDDMVIDSPYTLFIDDITSEYLDEAISVNVQNIANKDNRINLDSYFALNILQTEAAVSFEAEESWPIVEVGVNIPTISTDPDDKRIYVRTEINV